jgi:hypothetical protein
MEAIHLMADPVRVLLVKILMARIKTTMTAGTTQDTKTTISKVVGPIYLGIIQMQISMEMDLHTMMLVMVVAMVAVVQIRLVTTPTVLMANLLALLTMPEDMAGADPTSLETIQKADIQVEDPITTMDIRGVEITWPIRTKDRVILVSPDQQGPQLIQLAIRECHLMIWVAEPEIPVLVHHSTQAKQHTPESHRMLSWDQ